VIPQSHHWRLRGIFDERFSALQMPVQSQALITISILLCGLFDDWIMRYQEAGLIPASSGQLFSEPIP